MPGGCLKGRVGANKRSCVGEGDGRRRRAADRHIDTGRDADACGEVADADGRCSCRRSALRQLRQTRPQARTSRPSQVCIRRTARPRRSVSRCPPRTTAGRSVRLVVRLWGPRHTRRAEQDRSSVARNARGVVARDDATNNHSSRGPSFLVWMVHNNLNKESFENPNGEPNGTARGENTIPAGKKGVKSHGSGFLIWKAFKVWWETCEKGGNPEKCVRGNTHLFKSKVRWRRTSMMLILKTNEHLNEELN